MQQYELTKEDLAELYVGHNCVEMSMFTIMINPVQSLFVGKMHSKDVTRGLWMSKSFFGWNFSDLVQTWMELVQTAQADFLIFFLNYSKSRIDLILEGFYR